MRGLARSLAVAACVATLACAGDRGGDKAVVIASGGDGDVLIPLLWTETQARMYTELMFDKLADIGPGMNTIGDAGYEPRLATRWEWAADSMSVTFHLDPRAKWHDGAAVRAGDVRFAFQVFTDPKTASGPGVDMAAVADSVTAPDSLTVRVWYKARFPEQFHAIAYNLIPLPEHLLGAVPRDSLRFSAFASHPVGNGPFAFGSWEKRVRMELLAFDDFARGRPKLDRVVFAIFADAATAVRAVLAGDADFVETIGLDEAAEADRHPDVRLYPRQRFEYGFANFNLHARRSTAPHPIFADASVRRALTMATDRVAMARAVFDTLGAAAIGPFSRKQWSADTTLRTIPFDVSAARALLDSAGWTPGPDGVRVRGGRRLAFSMVTSATSKVRVRLCELMQQAFRAVGAEASIDAVDQSALRARVEGHDFDIAVFSWVTTPSPVGARQSWMTRAYQPGKAFNAGGYSNRTFDAQVDSGLAARSLADARRHFRVAYQTIIDDAPAVWLYEPFFPAAANVRVAVAPMRADAWWQSIPQWDVTGPPRRAGGAGGAAGRAP